MGWWVKFTPVSLAYVYKKDIMTILASVLCIGIGITVLIGWYTHTSLLFQTHPGLTPMYFNGALCFVFLGIGMLILFSPYKKVASVLGIAVVTISGITLLEYLLNTNLGIDQFFFKTYMNLHPSIPDRMSSNSSISFLACGIAITLLSLGSSRLIYCIVLLLAICALALASISLLGGYVAQLPATHQWAKLPPMGLYTAVTFVITSSGIFFYVYVKHASGEINLSSTLPYFTALFVLCVTVLRWQGYIQEATQNIQELTNTEAEKIQENIKKELNERISDLEKLALQWQIFPEVSEKTWINSSELYRKNIPWYRSIELIDSSLHIRAVTPLQGNEALLNLALDSLPLLHETLGKVKNEQKLKISKIINLSPEGRGFLICVPFFKKSHFEGFVIGTIDIDLLLKGDLKKNANSKFEVAFFEDKNAKQSFFQFHTHYIREINSKKEINVYNLQWIVEVWPSVEFYNQHAYTVFSKLILFIGPLIAFFFFVVIRSRQKAREKSIRLQESKKNLELQLLESSGHTKDLQYLKNMTDALQICSSLGKAAIPIAKFCKLFFPSTSGIVYLADNHSKILSPFSHWGTRSTKLPAFSKNKCLSFRQGSSFYMSGRDNKGFCPHIKRTLSKQIKQGFLCIPLLDRYGSFGLLHICDSHILSQPESEQKKQILLAETFARQLSLSLSSLKMRDLLSNQAIVDPLTGLYNRRYLDESLQRELYRAKRHSHPITLLMLDIDYFKKINDMYGHAAGDEVLKRIGLLLQEHSRKSDIACRFGGEEFILILPETTLHIALQRAKELQRAVTALSLSFEEETIKNLSISLGVATYPQHGLSMKAIITAADQALYKAKALGRNRIEIAKDE